MDRASIAYLVVDIGLFALFALIVSRIYRRRNRTRGELAKYRMLEDD
jgi:hypothetical protein